MGAAVVGDHRAPCRRQLLLLLLLRIALRREEREMMSLASPSHIRSTFRCSPPAAAADDRPAARRLAERGLANATDLCTIC